jgi:polyisoprenoid-binding protein YceI
MRIVKVLALSLALSVAAFAHDYSIDRAHSYVGFKIKHMMVSNVKGKFSTFTGEVSHDGTALTKFNGEVDVASIDTGITKRDDHLRNDDFFNVAKYPKLTFIAEKFTADTVTGQLTMHGVSKTTTLEYEFNGPVKDSRGNLKAGISMSGKISRKDFGLQYNRILEAGGVAIGDTVKLEIELELKQQ